MVLNFFRRWFFGTVTLLDKWSNSRLIYVFRLEAVILTGCMLVIPLMYEDYCRRLCTAVFGVFLALQIIVNWICIRYVSSEYDVNKYGHPPTDCFTRRNNETPESTSRKPITSFPYFSWAPCLSCDRARPPRCHHCRICNTCILKRDHHCFFAGACVGYLNYRHFVVFLFWAAIAAFYLSVHALIFYVTYILPNSSVIDLFIPCAVIRSLFGNLEWKCVFFNIHAVCILGFVLWITSWLRTVVHNVRVGITKFETDCGKKILDTRPLSGKLEGVFGNYWFLNFIVPLHFKYEPIDDPLVWPNIKVD